MLRYLLFFALFLGLTPLAQGSEAPVEVVPRVELTVQAALPSQSSPKLANGLKLIRAGRWIALTGAALALTSIPIAAATDPEVAMFVLVYGAALGGTVFSLGEIVAVAGGNKAGKVLWSEGVLPTRVWNRVSVISLWVSVAAWTLSTFDPTRVLGNVGPIAFTTGIVAGEIGLAVHQKHYRAARERVGLASLSLSPSAVRGARGGLAPAMAVQGRW